MAIPFRRKRLRKNASYRNAFNRNASYKNASYKNAPYKDAAYKNASYTCGSCADVPAGGAWPERADSKTAIPERPVWL
jgi:hypothetical protein